MTVYHARLAPSTSGRGRGVRVALSAVSHPSPALRAASPTGRGATYSDALAAGLRAAGFFAAVAAAGFFSAAGLAALVVRLAGALAAEALVAFGSDLDGAGVGASLGPSDSWC